MKALMLKCIISVVAIVIAMGHMIWPSFTVDAITITLIIIAILPWLSLVFKSIELPGGLKIEYQDLKKYVAEARQSGLINDDTIKSEEKYSFRIIASSDPNLALAGLRIELEKRLVKLAESWQLQTGEMGLNQLLIGLNDRQVIGGSERALLADLIGTLNSAVHGAKVDDYAVNWVLDVGPRILRALDERANTKIIRYEGIAPKEEQMR